ncbi:hypothetical protein [Mesorhizobium sp. M7A.F.Ca.MR.245.00.0.0]|uniref:hypothetical protein n=1 Tax=Mesorhizobium sp. M7A.F.Ca.MR.245.00.0.0 TaxID=2496778 RepID=UPI001FDFF2B1|nr:hypothetical protein [Mesorhizobium sp. M7A.F.Ca.MR.245.00.0.0]
MGELIMSAPVAGLTSKSRIAAEDVAMLRHEVFGDGVVTRGEAEALFALDATAKDKCQEWPPFSSRRSPTISSTRKSRRAISRKTMPTG